MCSKTFMVFLYFLLVSSTSFATYLPTPNRTVPLGPVGLTPQPLTLPESGFESTYFLISASTIGGGPGYAEQFVKWGGPGTQYQVPPNKTLYCPSWSYNTSSTTNGFTLGSATAPFANNVDMTTLTGAIFYGGNNTGNPGFVAGNPNSINTDLKVYVWNTVNLPITFGASSYPFAAVMVNAQNYYFNLLCKEL